VTVERWEEELAELTPRAVALREWLDPLPARGTRATSPIEAELAGLPKGGKTSLKKLLHQFFRRAPVSMQVNALPEGPEELLGYREEPRYTYQNLHYSLGQILADPLSTYYHLDLLDRGPVDSAAWFYCHEERGVITAEERDIAVAFILSPRLLSDLDGCVVVICDPKVSLAREATVALSPKPGRYMNEEMLGRLNRAYRTVYEIVKGRLPTLLLDTTNEGPKESAVRVIRHIIECGERRMKREAGNGG
jgi:hypothetical protein